MAEEQKTPGSEQQDPGQQAPVSAPQPAPSSPDAAEGKSFAVLSYALNFVGLPFFLVPLIMRNNEFSLFHAKQCLIIWLGGIVASAVGVPLSVVCIGLVILPVAAVFLLVLNIMGLINAAKGELKPLPLIGQWAVDWFKGIKKV